MTSPLFLLRPLRLLSHPFHISVPTYLSLTPITALPLRTFTTIPARQPPPPPTSPSSSIVSPNGIGYIHPNPPRKRITTHPPPPSTLATLPQRDAIGHITNLQFSELDPTGARRALICRTTPSAAHVGDILLVQQRGGDPFAGVCLSIRRRGVDSAILLRNQLTRIGVEMWFKVFSPNVEGVQIIKRKEKRARRARLYYLRKKEHDIGSVQGIVYGVLKQREAIKARAGRAEGEAEAEEETEGPIWGEASAKKTVGPR